MRGPQLSGGGLVAGLFGQLAIKQRTLALDAPGVAGERAVVSHDPMAWDRDCEVVCGASAGDGPDSLGHSDPARHFSVRHRLTNRDVLKGPPYPLLERRTPDIERKVETEARRFDEADDTGY